MRFVRGGVAGSHVPRPPASPLPQLPRQALRHTILCLRPEHPSRSHRESSKSVCSKAFIVTLVRSGAQRRPVVQKIRALFWDVGGVLLSNAWDHEERDQAVETFLLSEHEFEARTQYLTL